MIFGFVLSPPPRNQILATPLSQLWQLRVSLVPGELLCRSESRLGRLHGRRGRAAVLLRQSQWQSLWPQLHRPSTLPALVRQSAPVRRSLKLVGLQGDALLVCRRTGVVSMAVGHIALALERSAALWLARDYEGRSRLWLAMLALGFQWGFAVASVGPALGRVSPLVPACVPSRSHVHSILPGLVLELLGTGLFLVIRMRNKQLQRTSILNQALHTLPIRYQIR